jgi:hypothetical protein
MAQKIFDLKKEGCKTTHNWCNTTAGSPVIKFQYRHSYKAGDWIVVVKTDAKRGEESFGVFPELAYSSFEEMMSDTSQPENTFCRIVPTGDNYKRYNNTWNKIGVETVNGGGYVAEQNYYLAKAIPISLYAQIIRIDGQYAYLDREVSITVKRAEVFFDNAKILLEKFRTVQFENVTIKWTSGRYCLGEAVYLENYNGLTFKGNGIDKTVLFSPNGVPNINLTFWNCSNCNLSDFSIEGNIRHEGFGMTWWSDVRAAKTVYEQYDRDPSFFYARGLTFMFCNNIQVKNYKAIDVLSTMLVEKSNEVYGTNCHAVLTEGTMGYEQWQFQQATSKGGGGTDCTITSPTLTGGFESFGSVGTKWVRMTCLNAVSALNDAGGVLVDHPVYKISKGSMPKNKWFPIGASVLSNNQNAGNTNIKLMNTVVEPTIIVEGYIDEMKNGIDGFNTESKKFEVIGGIYEAPEIVGRWGMAARVPDGVVKGLKVKRKKELAVL